MHNQTRILYSDCRVKSFAEKLQKPDVQDMLAQIYQPGVDGLEWLTDYDPGRFRPPSFFHVVYGSTPEEVMANLSEVDFCGQRVQFNSRNGAAQALEAVGKKLKTLLKHKPALREYLFPLSGAFNWRRIAGEERLSPHAWAIAIDLNSRKGAYWRWGSQRGLEVLILRRAFPQEIVQAFEKHGFIWGGKWSHYDLMHFEYRPELLWKTFFCRNPKLLN